MVALDYGRRESSTPSSGSCTLGLCNGSSIAGWRADAGAAGASTIERRRLELEKDISSKKI